MPSSGRWKRYRPRPSPRARRRCAGGGFRAAIAGSRARGGSMAHSWHPWSVLPAPIVRRAADRPSEAAEVRLHPGTRESPANWLTPSGEAPPAARGHLAPLTTVPATHARGCYSCREVVAGTEAPSARRPRACESAAPRRGDNCSRRPLARTKPHQPAPLLDCPIRARYRRLWSAFPSPLGRADRMSPSSPPDVTRLLQAWSDGDAAATDRLFSAVYRDLHLSLIHI